ncbi:MAG: hypothetical protein AB9891_09650 [Anaerolineaceae bacterium]
MTFSSSSIRRVLAGVLLVSVFLSGCQSGASATPTAAIETLAPAIPPTPIPTDAAGRIILVAPGGVDPARIAPIQAVLQELSDAAGFAFEVRTDIPTGVIAANWKAIFLLGSLPNQDELAAGAPATQFVAFDGIEIKPAANVSFLRVNPAYRAFMAGYIGALVAPDWRVGGLLPSENAALEDAFINGGQYWCGRCGQNNPPFTEFPATQTLLADSTPMEWQTAVGELLKFNTEVIYVSPEATSPELLVSLAGLNLSFVGSQTPPDQVREKWVATLTQDVTGTIRSIWPELIAGHGGKTYDVALEVTDINEFYLSPGKVRLIEETMAALTGGFISPFTVEE